MEAAEAIALVKGHIEYELLLRNEYLAAENEILKSRLEGRLSFTTAEKVRLAKLGKEIGRGGLKDIRVHRHARHDPAVVPRARGEEVRRLQTEEVTRPTAH